MIAEGLVIGCTWRLVATLVQVFLGGGRSCSDGYRLRVVDGCDSCASILGWWLELKWRSLGARGGRKAHELAQDTVLSHFQPPDSNLFLGYSRPLLSLVNSFIETVSLSKQFFRALLSRSIFFLRTVALPRHALRPLLSHLNLLKGQ
jgi:hypothetical protein